MADPVSITHAFVSTKPASTDATKVDGPKWNAEHSIVLSGPGMVGAAIAGPAQLMDLSQTTDVLSGQIALLAHVFN